MQHKCLPIASKRRIDLAMTYTWKLSSLIVLGSIEFRTNFLLSKVGTHVRKEHRYAVQHFVFEPVVNKLFRTIGTTFILS